MEKKEIKAGERSSSETVGAVVARDYRAASVLESHGIDFCCGGNVPLEQACRDKGVDPEQLRRELELVASRPLARDDNYDAWDLPFLTDYIVNTHHVYLRENIPAIISYLHKIAEVHGPRHPEVVEISSLFDSVAGDMALHLQKEEEQLFPAVKRIFALKGTGGGADDANIQELERVLAELGHEHDGVGAAIHEIRRLADNYTVPPDVCNTFMVSYQKLKEFEADLHKHVHLENNILFPKTENLAKAATDRQKEQA